MAIFQQVNRHSAANTAAIAAGPTAFNARFRYRMTDRARYKFGSWNCGRFVNNSTEVIRVHFTLGPVADDFIDIFPKGIRNVTVDDGRSFYAFDVENRDAANDVAIGEFTYAVWTTRQLPEKDFIRINRRRG